ncbi:MAG: sigma-70 family RNA polymerase sigma factor [Bacillota bacterium]
MLQLILSSSLAEMDKDILVEIYEKYSGVIRKTAMGIVKNASDMEDVEHDVILKLIKNIETLKQLEEKSIAGYIITTAKFTSFDLLRKRNRRKETLLEDVFSSVDEREIEDKKEIAGFSSLAQKEQLLMNLKYVEEMSSKEIAKQFNTTENAINLILFKAKEKIRKNL